MNRTKDNIEVKQGNQEVRNKRKRKSLTLIPSAQQIQQAWDYVINRPNRRREKHRENHQCLFLLCWKAGLRVNEAINFDLSLQHTSPEYKDFYLLRGKGQKDRYVYIAPDLLKELKARNWKPKKDNVGRITFFEYLQRLKQEIALPANVEFAPHTLRRCFATHNAINGMPLAILQKYLGHAKITTTALYVKNSELSDLLKYKPII